MKNQQQNKPKEATNESSLKKPIKESINSAILFAAALFQEIEYLNSQLDGFPLEKYKKSLLKITTDLTRRRIMQVTTRIKKKYEAQKQKR